MEFADNLIKIADNKRSLSSESSSSEDDDIPELESLLDRENLQPIPVPPPLEIPPPYAMSGQRAVRSKGVPKSTFHPYSCNCRPLAHMFECAKVEAGRLHDCPLSWRTTPMSPLYSPGGYRVVDSWSDGKDQRRSYAGTGGILSYSRSGGDCHISREEGSESSSNSFSRTRARQLQQTLLLGKRYREDREHAERLQKMGCFGWGPGITE